MSKTIIIDTRETARMKSAATYFAKQGYHIDTQKLKTGDYLINDKVVFEFKTWPDFMASITDNRLFNETISQMEEYPIHFLVLHGTNRDYKEAYQHNGLDHNNITGAIARLLTYTKIIRSTGTLEDCFNLMMVTAEKCLDEKTLCKNFGTKSINPAFNVLSRCVDDINAERAKNIVNFLNLNTFQDVCSLTYEDLVKVPGIGDVLAKKILKAIGDPE